MTKSDRLLTRLLVGVLKHQAKRHLGEDVLEALLEVGSEHLGEELLGLLEREQSTRGLAQRLSSALSAAAAEIEREQPSGVALRLDEAPEVLVQSVVDALTNLESDYFGRRLQSAILDLVGAAGPQDAELGRRISMLLFQAVLITVVTIPELQSRAQDLLQQSRMWVLAEHLSRIEMWASRQHLPGKLVSNLESCIEEGGVSIPPNDKQRRLPPIEADELKPGLRVAAQTIELEKQLGQGGFGSVWQGRIALTGDLVAVKFLAQEFNNHPNVVRAFQREAKVTETLAGDAVLTVVRAPSFEDGRHFYVYRYLESSRDLEVVLTSNEIPLSRKLDILCKVAKVLHSVHEKGWVHGDVKPQNILIQGASDDVYLIDFGSAIRIGKSAVPETITFTYAYAAPELLAPSPVPTNYPDTDLADAIGAIYTTEIRPDLDVYPLGVMLFQAIDPGLARIARMEEYWLITRLITTPDLKAVLRKALARNSMGRFHTALEFKLALGEAVRSAIEDEDAL